MLLKPAFKPILWRENPGEWRVGTYVSPAFACTLNYGVGTCVCTYILGRENLGEGGGSLGTVSVQFFCVVRYICRDTYVRTYV